MKSLFTQVSHHIFYLLQGRSEITTLKRIVSPPWRGEGWVHFIKIIKRITSMKSYLKNLFVFLTLLMIYPASQLYAQPQWIYQKNLYFDSSGLIGTSNESAAQVGDSVTYLYTWGMKNMVYHEGMFYQAFAQTENGWNVYLRKSSDGINWSEKVRIDDDTSGANQYYAGITVSGSGNDTRIIVKWADFREANPQLRCAVSTDGGNTFSPSVAISSHTDSDVVDGNIAADAEGNLFAAWFRRTPGNAYYYTYFSKSTDGGYTWSPQEIIFTGRIYSYPPMIVAAEDGKLMVVINDDQNNRRNLVTRYSSNHGTSWETRTQITNYGFGEGAHNWFSLNIGSDNSIYVIFEYGKNNASDNKILISKTTDWGITWSELTQVSDPIQIFLIHEYHGSGNPSVVISPNGNVYAVWADQRYDLQNKIWNVYLSRSTDGGETWSNDILVNGLPETEIQLHTSVAIKSDGVVDTVVVTWNDRREDATNVETDFYSPSDFYLYQNYPNPFNPKTVIGYQLPVTGYVTLKVYDMLGREVVTLVNEYKVAGKHSVEFNAASAGGGLPSGVYFYRIQAGELTETKKLLLLK